MHGLVERLLILAQGDVDAFLNVQEVDLNEVVRSAVENTLIGSNGKASIDVGLPVAAVMVSIESDLVTQALVILLDNAVKFSMAGGLVDVRLTTTTDEVAVVVRDTGIGISQADLTGFSIVSIEPRPREPNPDQVSVWQSPIKSPNVTAVASTSRASSARVQCLR